MTSIPTASSPNVYIVDAKSKVLNIDTDILNGPFNPGLVNLYFNSQGDVLSLSHAQIYFIYPIS